MFDHTPAGASANEWLPAGHPGAGPERAHRILVAQSVFHHYEKNESRGSRGCIRRELAGTILYLCSPAARYVCGATIIADGASMQGNWVSSLLPGPDEF